MKGQRIGYIRVSAYDQNPERQLEGIKLDRTFTDRASGKNAQRLQLEELMSFARSDDVVYIHSMDRLARNLDDLRQIVQSLTGRGVEINLGAALLLRRQLMNHNTAIIAHCRA